MPKKLTLALSAALLPVAALTIASRPDPPLCRVQVQAAPERLNRFYLVKVGLRDDCPANAMARVRLESYVGGTYPRNGWFTVTRHTPLIRRGIPWYWRVAWQSQAGTPYFLNISPESP